MRSEDASERRAACRAAADDPSSVLLVDFLCEALGDPDHGVASAAVDALAEIGRRDASVRRALDRALRGDDARRRWGAALTYARLEPPPVKLLPVLVEAIGAPDRHVRWAAAKLVVDLGRLHPEALPVLLDCSANDPRRDARRMAVHALRELAPDLPETAQALLVAARDADVGLRRASLTALASLPEPPAEALERLIEVLGGDDDGASRLIAATALGELGAALGTRFPAAAAEALRNAASTADDPDLRRGAARALQRLGANRGDQT
jgi:HEAT repeat protein